MKGGVLGTGNQQERQSSNSQGAYLLIEERHIYIISDILMCSAGKK